MVSTQTQFISFGNNACDKNTDLTSVAIKIYCTYLALFPTKFTQSLFADASIALIHVYFRKCAI